MAWGGHGVLKALCDSPDQFICGSERFWLALDNPGGVDGGCLCLTGWGGDSSFKEFLVVVGWGRDRVFEGWFGERNAWLTCD